MELVYITKTSFNLKRSSLAVFVDFLGDYDTIWRNRLLNKFHVYGIGGKKYNWYLYITLMYL